MLLKLAGIALIIIASIYVLIWVVPSTIPVWLKVFALGGELFILGNGLS
jgi:hypothetical protein